MIDIASLENRLRKFDWYYVYSDDSGVYRAMGRLLGAIETDIDALIVEGNDRAAELLNKFEHGSHAWLCVNSRMALYMGA